MKTIKDENYAAYARSLITEYGENKEGEFISKLGMVKIYHSNGMLQLSLAHNERVYYRTIYGVKYSSDRSLAIYAGKFQREIVKKEV